MGRWRRHLDPSIKRDGWEEEEDEQLRELYGEYGECGGGEGGEGRESMSCVVRVSCRCCLERHRGLRLRWGKCLLRLLCPFCLPARKLAWACLRLPAFCPACPACLLACAPPSLTRSALPCLCMPLPLQAPLGAASARACTAAPPSSAAPAGASSPMPRCALTVLRQPACCCSAFLLLLCSRGAAAQLLRDSPD